jgi:hypothetical protein
VRSQAGRVEDRFEHAQRELAERGLGSALEQTKDEGRRTNT